MKRKAPPPIDYLRAIALERKASLHLSYDDLAAISGYSASHIRHAWSSRHPADWTPAFREDMFKALQVDDAAVKFFELLTATPEAKVSFNVASCVLEMKT